MAISSNKLIRLDKVNFIYSEKQSFKKYLESKLDVNQEVTLDEIICDKNFLPLVEINGKVKMNSFILAGLIICFYSDDFELIMENDFFSRGEFKVKRLLKQ